MNWHGDFVFGDTWAAYRGPAADNAPHAHAALQLVFGLTDDIRVRADAPGDYSAAGFLIRPGASHAIVGSAPVGLVWIEVESALAFSLLDLMAEAAAIEPAPPALLRLLDRSAPPAAWLVALQSAFPRPGRELDSRVRAVLDRLSACPRLPIAEAARDAAVSESRLRELVREQLGVPLSTWLTWRKLERAAREMAAGSSLAEAAVAGGFADQAHHARTMRRMFGISPGMARAALG